MKTLLELAESHRREMPSMSTYPLHPEERAVIARRQAGSATLGDPEYLIDYATAGHKIAQGCTHLDEGLPSGQKTRCEYAFKAIQEGVVEMQLWMRARGYNV